MTEYSTNISNYLVFGQKKQQDCNENTGCLEECCKELRGCLDAVFLHLQK